MRITDVPYQNILPYQGLANGIILQAVADYRNALDGFGYDNRPPKAVIKECEKFFRSSRYQMLTKVKGEYLIEQLKKEHKEKQKKEQV